MPRDLPAVPKAAKVVAVIKNQVFQVFISSQKKRESKV